MSDFTSAAPITIRTARPSDEAAILDICLRTADRGQDGSHCYSDPRLPGFVWALPYVRLCPENAFVLTRGEEVMGYCVAALDTVAYEQRLEEEWWPKLKAELRAFAPTTPQDENVLAYIRQTPRTPPQVTDLYPAHLHINLLPELQKGGHGSRIISQQLQSLEKAGLSGVHLGVDPRNESVTSFYGKFGFVEIDRTPSIVMGKKFP
ncbi:GNAT family N-acetyltransferase [Allorhizobium pseudoryzae]|uniref:GNAT family N-acetyltransferase n=1 Tax=Allorhizobium pseudoryzae TaxID=379684 RepID=UPI003D0244A9